MAALLDIACEETFIAKGVDQAWNAFGVTEDAPESRLSEVRALLRAGNAEAMLDVLADFVAIQRTQVIADGDALAQLAQIVIVQALPQLGLAHKHDLQELAVVGLEIGQQADLFEELVGEILRFIDDEHGIAAGVCFGEEEAVDFGDGFQAIHALDVEAELHGDGLDELVGVQDGIEDERGRKVGSELFEERAAKSGLAGTDFAGDLHKSFSFANAVKQVVESLTMFRAVKQKARIRRDAERRFF